jgi:hypothetical protein
MVEIGCGTGSSTAAFATICKSITAYDIASNDVELAKERLKHFGATNATAHAGSFEQILRKLDEQDVVNGVLLFAVLEHMFVAERLEVLRRAWLKMPPGGARVICETPNRLSYFDRHTFLQPFAICSPELAKLWAPHCVNTATRAAIEGLQGDDYMKLRDGMVRMGQSGPSFHEFELALGVGVHQCIMSGDKDPEVEGINGPYRLEQDLLATYFRERCPHVNPAFAMPMLYLIICKPLQGGLHT